MDSSDVKELVEDLGSNIDELEESLAPLLKSTITSSTSKLPLLDKAKLYVLATYAIDSVLFSYLRVNGVDIKNHAVAQEIARVRSYFQKIKEAETGPAQRNTTLDKDAAARFIKHGLSGNDKYDQQRQQRQAAEKAGAKRKAEELEASAQYGSQYRFAGMAKRVKENGESVGVVKFTDSDDENGQEATGGEDQSKEEKKVLKHQRRMERKQAKQSPVEGAAPDAEGQDAAAAKLSKKGSTAPKSSHDTFHALLQGPLPKEEKSEKKKRKRRSKGQMQQDDEDTRAAEMK